MKLSGENKGNVEGCDDFESGVFSAKLVFVSSSPAEASTFGLAEAKR